MEGEEDLLGAGVLGHSLCAFRDGVLGQLAGQKETDGRLDFLGRDFFKSFIARDFCISYYTVYNFVLFFIMSGGEGKSEKWDCGVLCV